MVCRLAIIDNILEIKVPRLIKKSEKTGIFNRLFFRSFFVPYIKSPYKLSASKETFTPF